MTSQRQCIACNKVYSTPTKLNEHHQRQPLCARWIEASPVLKEYVDAQFQLPSTDMERDQCKKQCTCHICNESFATTGNLNRHFDTSVICGKWRMYNQLMPLTSHVVNHLTVKNRSNLGYASVDQINQKGVVLADRGKKAFEELFVQNENAVLNDVKGVHVAPKHKLCHIIWNLFLIDKTFFKKARTDGSMNEIISENKFTYIVAILPEDSPEFLESIAFPTAQIKDYSIMVYRDHDTSLDFEAFDRQCKEIEKRRALRENTMILCNSGYQRSIPFLTYYLTRYHGEEVPSVEHAIDIILPQVDNENYAAQKDEYVKLTKELLA